VTARHPFVVVLYKVPLFCEALDSALDDLAEVQRFPAGRGDTVGLLRSIRPDAIVVDDPSEAERARRWARRHRVPLLLVGLREETIRILRNGRWEERPGATVEAIRNALAGLLFGQRNTAA
jgi:hypothetical protein